MNIPKDVAVWDPTIIAIVFNVSIDETRKIFYQFADKYGNMLTREERYNLTGRYVEIHKGTMKKIDI